jgi:hypothetical protein
MVSLRGASSKFRLTASGAKRTTNGKSASDRQKDDRAAKGAVALRGHSEKQLLALSRYPEVDIPCDERSFATLVGSSSAAIFLHICLDRASNLATGLSVCQSSTSWLSTSRLADLMADSSSIQSS